jgi:hypothetical protein
MREQEKHSKTKTMSAAPAASQRLRVIIVFGVTKVKVLDDAHEHLLLLRCEVQIFQYGFVDHGYWILRTGRRGQ